MAVSPKLSCFLRFCLVINNRALFTGGVLPFVLISLIFSTRAVFDQSLARETLREEHHHDDFRVQHRGFSGVAACTSGLS